MLRLTVVLLLAATSFAAQRLTSPLPADPLPSKTDPCGGDTPDKYQWAQWELGSRVSITWVTQGEDLDNQLSARFAPYKDGGPPYDFGTAAPVTADSNVGNIYTMSFVMPAGITAGRYIIQVKGAQTGWLGCSTVDLVQPDTRARRVAEDQQLPRTQTFLDSNPVESHQCVVTDRKIMTTWQNGYSPYFRTLQCENPYDICAWDDKVYFPLDNFEFEDIQAFSARSSCQEVVAFIGNVNSPDFVRENIVSYILLYNTTTSQFIYNTTLVGGTTFTLLYPYLDMMYAFATNDAASTQTIYQFPCAPVGKTSIGALSTYRAATPYGVRDKLIFGPEYQSSSGQNSRVDVYDLTKKTWAQFNMAVPRDNSVVQRCGKFVFIAGGTKIADGKVTDAIDTYNAESGNFVSYTDIKLTVPRGTMSAHCARGYAVFAGGRLDGGVPTDAVDYWWDDGTDGGYWGSYKLAQPRSAIGIWSVGELMVMAGGVAADNTFSSTVDVLDTLSEAWSAAQLSEPRAFLPIVATVEMHTVKDLTMFVMGGFKQFGDGQSTYALNSDSIDIFDRATLHARCTALSDNETYEFAESISSYVEEQFAEIYTTRDTLNVTLLAIIADLQAQLKALKASINPQCITKQGEQLGAAGDCFPAPNNNNNNPTNTGAILGAILGGTGVLVAGIIVFTCYRRRKFAETNPNDMEVRLLPTSQD
jgi:hypothetical protein